ncbi:MAG: alpha-ketoacid dehydrogenase subunit beta [Candidatus Wolframiiraptor sp. EX4484-121]|nr:MAG: alpha-ketoacid dehydrogenase subunit beta [Candidatus Wolframiiraptor sp. EX4484-121]
MGSGVREISYAEALNEALREEMRRDERVIVFGEDVGVLGGVYRVTKGLLEEFGPERVLDTPISEAAIAGTAIGAALMGLRPVAEIMYVDFLTLATDMIITHAAKARFMSGGQVKLPMVIRTQYSLGRVHGCQHSQFLAACFLQSPGIKVVLPGTPRDAKGLLKSAIRDDDPVLFIESGALYRMKGPVPEDEYLIPLGRCDVKREGDDVTIVAVARTVVEALKAADRLAEEGLSAEVIDLMTIQPMDYDTIVKSVMKTNRLVIADDSVKTCGISAEVSAYVSEFAFDYLDAPIIRVNSPPLPIPFSPQLEKQYMVDADKIVDAVKRLVG